MVFKRITLVALIGIGITTSSAIATAQLNRSPKANPTLPCAQTQSPGRMMNRGMMSHQQITSEFDYLNQMIPHHQEAIATAKAVLERSDRPKMKAFAQDIIRVQSAEIQQMQTWLKEWYPNQKTAPTYYNMMRDLSQLKGDALDQVFLQDMMMHHMEAVHMSWSLLRHNLVEHEPVRPFAEQIASTQMQEIHQMQAWLQDWFGASGMMGGMGGRHRFNRMR